MKKQLKLWLKAIGITLCIFLAMSIVIAVFGLLFYLLINYFSIFGSVLLVGFFIFFITVIKKDLEKTNHD